MMNASACWIIAAVLEAYLDESGSHDASKVFALGGYLAPPDEWEIFDGHWRSTLKRAGIKVFHMRDYVACRREFEGWGDTSRINLLKELAEVIHRRDIWGVHYAINLEAYEKVAPNWARQKARAISPYLICMQFCIREITKELEKRGKPAEQIAFVFDQHGEWASRIVGCYLEVQRRVPEHSKVMGPISFGTRTDNCRLQAADLLAYESYKEVFSKIFEPKRPPRKSFEELVRKGRVRGGYMDRIELVDFFEKIETYGPA